MRFRLGGWVVLCTALTGSALAGGVAAWYSASHPEPAPPFKVPGQPPPEATRPADNFDGALHWRWTTAGGYAQIVRGGGRGSLPLS